MQQAFHTPLYVFLLGSAVNQLRQFSFLAAPLLTTMSSWHEGREGTLAPVEQAKVWALVYVRDELSKPIGDGLRVR